MDDSEFVLAFLNSSDRVQHGNDLFKSPERCETFFASLGLARSDVNWSAATPKIKAARDELREVFLDLTAVEPDYATLSTRLNSLLDNTRWSGAVRPGETELDIVFGPHQNQPYEKRITALAVAALVRITGEIGPERMRACQSSPCNVLYVDQSKAGRQRYCSKRCANRVNVAAHRARKNQGSAISA